MRTLLAIVVLGVGAAGANAATIESSVPADLAVPAQSLHAGENAAAPAQNTPDPYDWLDHVQTTPAVAGHSGGGVGHAQKAGHGTSPTPSHAATHATSRRSGSEHRGGAARPRAPRLSKMR